MLFARWRLLVKIGILVCIWVIVLVFLNFLLIYFSFFQLITWSILKLLMKWLASLLFVFSWLILWEWLILILKIISCEFDYNWFLFRLSQLLTGLLTPLASIVIVLDASRTAIFWLILVGSWSTFISVSLKLLLTKKWINNLILLELCRSRCKVIWLLFFILT